MPDRELTRRGALVALAAVAGGSAATVALTWDEVEDTGPLEAHDRQTILALAEVLYPSEVDGVAEFVETYVAGRVEDDPGKAAAIADAVAELDDHATAWYDAPFRELDAETRDSALRGFGVDEVEPDPEGGPVQRVRYHLVNELLFALFTSPTGGELVGLENPPGHPGGLTSYRQGP